MGSGFDATSFILNARKNSALCISEMELLHILSCRELSAMEKLMWLIIAYYTAAQDDLTCAVSAVKIAKLMQTDEATVNAGLAKLRELGFLKEHKEEVRFFTLSLPGVNAWQSH